MDTPSQALRKVREEVVASRAWSRLQRELQSQMAQSTAGQLLRGSLSAGEKLAAVERGVEAVGETSAYARLQAQVASAVDRHFSPLLFQPPPMTQEVSATSVVDTSRAHPEAADPLAEACSMLLKASPHLKHSLKYALNHPLPQRLRLSAWRVILQRPDVQKDFLVVGKEMQPRDGAEREISRRCEDIVGRNPAFRDLAGSRAALSAMQAVTLYWKRRASGKLLDSELLLCVPFVYVWREELERGAAAGVDGKEGRWVHFAEIAAQYVQFMEMLPPSVSGSATDSADGMNKFTQRVEELLQTEDPQLYKALGKIFKKTGGSERRGRRVGGNSFLHTLKSLLFPHIQKMFVGDVSMEVLCYIWDQCFIGMDVPEYQCLPYFTTVWLILLRHKLFRATSVEAVEKVLSVNSHSLTILQFQQEMEKTFLLELSRSLKVKPLPLHPAESSSLLPPLPSHLSHRPQSHPPPLSHNTHTLRRSRRKTHRVSTTDGLAESDLQQRMEEMQCEVEKEQRILSHRIREEREHHQKQLEIFRKELEELRTGLGERGRRGRGVTIGQSQSLGPSLQSPIQSYSSTQQQPTLLLVDPSSSSSSGKSNKLQEMKVIPVQIASQQVMKSDKERPYSPTNLSESDMQALWLQIFQRFTTAAYTICHGTGSEKQALLSALQSSTADTTKS